MLSDHRPHPPANDATRWDRTAGNVYENRSMTVAATASPPGKGTVHRGARPLARQHQAETAPLPPAVQNDVDAAPVLLDQGAGDGQPHAPAALPGAEPRVEDPARELR